MAARPFSGSAGPEIEALAGTIERVTFHSSETGSCVLKVQARGKRDLVPVIGLASAIAAYEWTTVTGIWHTDHQHGSGPGRRMPFIKGIRRSR